jgi:hypothetical protein
MSRTLTCTFRGQIIDPNISWTNGYGSASAYWLEANASFALPVLYRDQFTFPFFNFPSAMSEGRIGFHLKPVITSDSRIGALYDGSNYKIGIYRDDGNDMANRSLFLIVNGTYYYTPVHLRMQFDDSSTHIVELYWKCDGNNGIVKLYQNGVCLIELNPININATTLNKFMLGSFTTTWATYCYLEWVALESSDVELSPLKFARLAPNGAGSSTQLSAVPSGSNYDLVDAPLTGISALSQYCLADSANEQDSYNVAAPPSNIDTINALRVLGVAGQQAEGFLAKALVRTGNTDYVGDSVDVQHSYGLFYHRWTQNPNTNEAWTPNDLDGLEIGVKAVTS